MGGWHGCGSDKDWLQKLVSRCTILEQHPHRHAVVAHADNRLKICNTSRRPLLFHTKLAMTILCSQAFTYCQLACFPWTQTKAVLLLSLDFNFLFRFCLEFVNKRRPMSNPNLVTMDLHNLISSLHVLFSLASDNLNVSKSLRFAHFTILILYSIYINEERRFKFDTKSIFERETL